MKFETTESVFRELDREDFGIDSEGIEPLFVAQLPIEYTFAKRIKGINLKKAEKITKDKKTFLRFINNKFIFTSNAFRTRILNSFDEEMKAQAAYNFVLGKMKHEKEGNGHYTYGEKKEIADVCILTLPLTTDNYNKKISVDMGEVNSYLEYAQHYCYLTSLDIESGLEDSICYLENGEKFVDFFVDLNKNSKKEEMRLKPIPWIIDYNRDLGNYLELLATGDNSKEMLKKSRKRFEKVMKYSKDFDKVAYIDAKLDKTFNLVFSRIWPEAEELAKESFKEASGMNYLPAMGDAKRLLGVALFEQGRRIDAIEPYEEALKYYQLAQKEEYGKADTSIRIALTYNNLLICGRKISKDNLLKIGKEDILDKNLKAASEYTNIVDDVYTLSSLYQTIGNEHRDRNEYDEADEFYKKAIDVIRETGEPLFMRKETKLGYKLLIGISQFMDLSTTRIIERKVSDEKTNELLKTLDEYAEEGPGLFSLIIDRKAEALFHRGVFKVKGIQGNWDECYESLDNALNVYKEMGGPLDSVVNTYWDIGRVEKYAGREEYKEHRDKALEIIDEIEEKQNEDEKYMQGFDIKWYRKKICAELA